MQSDPQSFTADLTSLKDTPLYPHGSTKNRVGMSFVFSRSLTISSPTSFVENMGLNFSFSMAMLYSHASFINICLRQPKTNYNISLQTIQMRRKQGPLFTLFDYNHFLSSGKYECFFFDFFINKS